MSEVSSSPLPLARRIITGPDASATKSTVLYDDAQGNINTFKNGNRIQTLWYTETVPVDCSTATNEDPTGNMTFSVCNDGSVCSIVWMRPGSSTPMHSTKSIDYGVVLEGEVELELDNGDIRVIKTGDVIVQRGTRHAWHNRHATKWSKVLFVVIALKKPEGEAEATN